MNDEIMCQSDDHDEEAVTMIHSNISFIITNSVSSAKNIRNSSGPEKSKFTPVCSFTNLLLM